MASVAKMCVLRYLRVSRGLGIYIYTMDLPGDLCGFCGVRDPGRDPGHRAGPGVALDTRVRGTLPTPQYVPAAAPPLPLNV